MKLARPDSLEPYVRSRSAPFDARRANRVLSRLGFGATDEEVREAVEAGPDATLDRALRADDRSRGAARRDLLRSPSLPRYQGWWIAQALANPHAVRERWTLMWHDHFACSVHKPIPLQLMLRQNEVFRWLGDGPFGALLHAMLDDPAMLIWLDADQNIAGRTNENLAREILELFALGRGHYEQSDVRELARAFTGLRVRIDRVDLAEAAHDGGEKTLLGRSGLDTADEAVDVIAAHPACARWITARVWRWIVGAPPDDGLIDDLARTFIGDEMHVGRLIQRIARSRVFLEPDELPTRIAAPAELVLTMARRLDADVDPVHLAGLADRMGQSLFAPPSVDGWPSGRGWLGTSWCLRRLELAGEIIGHARSGVAAGAMESDPSDWVARVFCATDRDADQVRRAGTDLVRRGVRGLDAARVLLALPETHRV